MPLLDWLTQARDSRTEAEWWQEIADLRQYGNDPLVDLPASYSEFQRQIRALAIAGKVKREGELVSYQPPVVKQERTLF